MRNAPKTSIIFIDKLTFFSGINLSFYLFKNRPAFIKYLSKDRFGRLIASTLQRITKTVEFEQIHLDLSSPLPEGGGLWYWAQSITEEIAELILKEIKTDISFLNFTKCLILDKHRR